jgi:hypothetical protein
MTTDLSEKKERLWTLAASPTIWALHFLAAYGIAAVYCAKLPSASFEPARIAIVIVTALALGGVAVLGWRGWTRHRLVSAKLPHDDDSPLDRHRFLGFATALLSGMSAIAIGFEALAVFLVGSCR